MQEMQGEGWTRCTPGVLDRLAARIQTRRRYIRRTNVFAATISCTILTGILGLAGVLASQAMGIPILTGDPGVTQAHKPCPPPPFNPVP